MYKKRRTRGFIIIECENGYYAGGRGGGAAYDPDGKKIKDFKGDGGGAHAANFLTAVRSRKQKDLNAEIEDIHYSSAWCHLGNISWQLGQKYSREETLDRVKNFAPWAEVVDEFEEHCAANEINLKMEEAKLGAVLEIDAEKETFTGESATDEALALLRREYREGFQIPDQV